MTEEGERRARLEERVNWIARELDEIRPRVRLLEDKKNYVSGIVFIGTALLNIVLYWLFHYFTK